MSWWVEMGLVTLISRTPEFLTHLGVGWHLGELVLLSDSGMGRVASSTFLEGLSGGELFPLDTREDVLVGGDGASDLDLSDTRVSYPSWCWLGELVLLSDSGMGRVASSTFLEGLSGGELFPLDTREDVLVGGDGASDLDLSDTRVSYPSWCWLALGGVGIAVRQWDGTGCQLHILGGLVRWRVVPIGHQRGCLGGWGWG